ncbi:hypothetical protein HYPSUDRAFT_42410, partial [Hypholoma sublateritium FD-334 SS-4]
MRIVALTAVATSIVVIKTTRGLVSRVIAVLSVGIIIYLPGLIVNARISVAGVRGKTSLSTDQIFDLFQLFLRILVRWF